MELNTVRYNREKSVKKRRKRNHFQENFSFNNGKIIHGMNFPTSAKKYSGPAPLNIHKCISVVMYASISLLSKLFKVIKGRYIFYLLSFQFRVTTTAKECLTLNCQVAVNVALK